MSRLAAALLSLALLLPSGAGWAALQEKSQPNTVKGSPLEKVSVQQKLDTQIPLDAVFKDEAGREVRIGDYFGERPVLLIFAYYKCPMLCTLVLNGVVRVLNGVTLTPGKDYDIVVLSISPTETPELAAKKKAVYLKEYHRKGTGAGWHFLTGAEDQIRRVTDAAGFGYAYDAESGEYAHASVIHILTAAGKLSHYFFGIEYPARDVRLALVEASKGKIGGLVDQLLLFCFHYDPVTGKYSMMIMNLVRVVGAMTLVGMLTAIILMIKRERKA